MTNLTATELRIKIKDMSKVEMINLRNELESNWDSSLKPLMEILSLACINKFKTTLIKL